jgi:uncharacterized protein (DUF2147 family)
MRKSLLTLAVGLAVTTAPAAARADAFGGLWLTENGKAVVELAPCPERSICGSLYWLRDDAKQYDYQNPDPALRKRPLCGLRILWGFKPDGLAAWEDGTIYKADDGDTYHAEMEIMEDGRLHLRGHVGIALLGKSQNWTRVNPAQYPQCKGPKGDYDPALARADGPERPAGTVND